MTASLGQLEREAAHDRAGIAEAMKTESRMDAKLKELERNIKKLVEEELETKAKSFEVCNLLFVINGLYMGGKVFQSQ